MEFENIESYLRKGWYISFDDKFIDPVNVKTLSRAAYREVRSRFKKKVQIIKGARGNNPYEIEGDRVIHRKEDGNILLFDYEESILYRKWASKDQVDSVKRGIDTLKHFYNINPVEFFNDTVSKEKLLSGTTLRKASPERLVQVADQIIEKYYNALAEEVYPIFSPRISPDDFIDAAMKTNYPQEMKDFLGRHQDQAIDLLSKLRWTWGHSDLTADNIIVLDNSYYIIDIERCEVLPVGYDLFNLANVLIPMCQNSVQIKNYFKGKNDELFFHWNKTLKVGDSDRILLLIIMIFLKGIVPWDKKVKGSCPIMLAKRWRNIKLYFPT